MIDYENGQDQTETKMIHQTAEKSLIKQGEMIETHLQTTHHHLVPTI